MKKILFMTFLAVVIPFVVFAFIGCVKAPSTDIDYGVETSEQSVLDAVGDAVKNAAPTNPLSIQKDQFVSIEHTQALDIYTPIVISERADTVTDRTDTTTSFDLGIDIQLSELQSDGTTKYSRSHSDLPVDKQSISSTNPPTDGTIPEALAPARIAVTTMPPKIVKIQDYSLGGLKAKDQTPPTDPNEPKVSYYNLQKTSGTIPVPDAVKARPNCGGLSNCNTLRYVTVSFDRVVWDANNNGTKTSIQYVFSPDVPTYIYDWSNLDVMFFTTQISECAQQWVAETSQGTTRYVPVRDCRNLIDFRFGSATP